MSKTIEALNKLAHQKGMHASVQDEIAKTYFKIMDKKKTKTVVWKSLIPWVVVFIALSVALAAILTKSNIEVRVRILSEIPSITPEPKEESADILRDKGVFLVKKSEPNTELVRKTAFIGDAENYSRVEEEQLVLRNSRGSGWANYTVELNDPVNLNKLDLKYIAKGVSGDEHLVIVIVDSENRSYRMERDASTKLKKDWRLYTINFKRMKNTIDLSNISTIRFELGTLTAGNNSTASILLKDIYLTKTRREKWL